MKEQDFASFPFVVIQEKTIVVKENITGATNGLSDLSSEDMEIAYNLVVNDGYTGTIEDFSAKIKAAKEQADAETSNILNSHEGMDKIESLQSDDESTPDVLSLIHI